MNEESLTKEQKRNTKENRVNDLFIISLKIIFGF